MDITPQIFTARIIHKRLLPKQNVFNYGIYYLVLPLPAPAIPGKLIRFAPQDLGYRDTSDPGIWAKEALSQYGLAAKTKDIMLVTMPRILGYVFNPVSFYLCFDSQQQLRAVIAEVHNTFGEQHSYICAHSDHSPILSNHWLEGEKMFHVSPFLERNGYYRFRFAVRPDKLGIWINYYDQQQNIKLLTALTGNLSPLTGTTINRAFWRHPLVTLKTIALIHWQAAKLAGKHIKYIRKPRQLRKKTSSTNNLTKM